MMGDLRATPAYTTLSVQQFLIKGMTVVLHPPIHAVASLMKKLLKGKHFADVEEVKQKTAKALKGIKIDEFKNCFDQ